ncbi:MAG: phosphoribosylglycinamide formyltransferase [Deltaproteobacteria bacterium RIFCSPHIGHO2_02_FULL_40_11]|nr:MAG: phosphoribosylglycinamide formyltransferase [Deltaproteobacteria bacterium RIFCSPHIGHO2_02_FULL_40_11]
MHKKTKLGVLASGKGTNLEAILKACKGKDYPAYVGVVISDQKEAPALQKATAQDVPGIFIDPKLYETREAFDQMLTLTLKQYQVDLVVLAGFMRILSPVFIHAFPKKAINIHPALLPKYPGQHAVQDALKAGEKKTGCTVHFIDEGIDTGPILAQAEVPILENDTVEKLHARIQKEEHALYPKVISDLAKKIFER